MNGVSFQQLSNNREKQAATLYVIVIGEATKRLSPEFSQPHPQIDWESMAGMRDVVVHQCDRVNVQVVWEVGQTDLPELLTLLKSLTYD